MDRRKAFRWLALIPPLAVAACATYVPPEPASPEAFSRDLPASYDRTWSALTYVAGASFFKIKAFEKASGLMTLDFDLKEVIPYVDCGSARNSTTHTTTPALLALGLSGVTLDGTANINIMSEGHNRTAIQFNSQYTLDGYRPGPYGEPEKVAEWSFTSGTSDTQNVGVPVTCRSSYKIESDFLTEVSARL
jgi:hypothetical protein